jgi:hypothetical protein
MKPLIIHQNKFLRIRLKFQSGGAITETLDGQYYKYLPPGSYLYATAENLKAMHDKARRELEAVEFMMGELNNSKCQQ